MSSQPQPSTNEQCGLLNKVCNAPRVQKVVTKWKSALTNIYNKHNHGQLVLKANAIDTLNEMTKFYSPTEIKAVLGYTKNLAKETHEELVGSKFRLMSETFRTVFESQTRSIFKRNNFAIDEDDSSDEQE